MAEQLREAEKAVEDSSTQLKAIQAESEVLATEVAKALGTKEAYEADRAVALDISKPRAERDTAAERVKIWDENRKFFGKLQSAAHSNVMASVATSFAEAAKLDGVNREILMGPDLAAAFRHVHEAGAKAVADSKDAQIKKLETEIVGLKASAAGKGVRTPIATGRPQGGFDVSEMIDPKTGLLSDDSLRQIMSGALRG